MRFIVFLIQLLIWFHAEPLFWIIIFLLFISFCVYCVIIDESNNSNKSSSSSTQTPSSSSNNQVSNTQSSTSASPQNIQWTEVGTYYSNNSQTSEQNQNITFDNDFLNGKNQNFNINELLTHLVGQKDRVSSEILQPGEKIYVCEPCQLGYHKDSWEFLNKKCEQCDSSINKLYSLPIAITFTDIPQTQNIESFNGAENLLNSGLKKAKNQNYGEAIKHFSEALRLNSNFAEAYYNRGQAYYEIGNYQAAIDDFTQAITLNPNYDVAYNERGVAYHKQRILIRLAIKDFTQALYINPRFADAYNNRGKAHYTLNNISAAIKDYNQALSIEPNNTEARNNLNIARSKLKNKQRKQNYNNHDISSRSTKVCEKYISVLDLDTIYENIGKDCYLKGIIISVFIDNQYEIIHFKFSVNTSDSFYAYVPKKSFHLFPNASSLTVKNVIISGKISLNRRNRPVIVINTPSQITELN